MGWVILDIQNLLRIMTKREPNLTRAKKDLPLPIACLRYCAAPYTRAFVSRGIPHYDLRIGFVVTCRNLQFGRKEPYGLHYGFDLQASVMRAVSSRVNGIYIIYILYASPVNAHLAYCKYVVSIQTVTVGRADVVYQRKQMCRDANTTNTN